MMKKSLLLTVLLFSAVLGRTAWGQKTLPYSYGFENNDLATEGWTMVDCDEATHISSDPGALHQGSYGFAFMYNTNPPQYLISPELEQSVTGITVLFYYKNWSLTENFQVGYSTNTNAISDFSWGDEITASSGNWEVFEAEYSSSVKFIAIKYNSNDMMALCIDDISIEAKSPYVVPQSLTLDKVTVETAELSWSAPSGDVTSYKYQYKQTSAAWNDEDETTTSTSVSLSGLTAHTGYDFRVKAMYGANESVYATTSFYTDCASIQSLPYACGFENEEQDCWTMVDLSPNSGIDNTYHTGPHSFKFGYPSYPQYLISPKFDGNNAIAVTFYYRIYNDANPEKFQVGYSTTTTDTDAFTWHNEITATESVDWVLYDDNFPVGTKFIAVKYNSDNQYYLFIDDFSFVVAPSCPKPTSFSVSSITSESAYISWVSDADNFAIQYKKLSSAIWTSTTSTTNSCTLEGLEGETEYEVQVKAICGGENGESDWSQSLQFITSYATPVVLNFDNSSYTDDFEGDNLNWKFINGKLTNEWYWGTATNNGGSKAIYISNDGGVNNSYTNNAPTLIYAIKSFALLQTKYNISYDWKANGESGTLTDFDYLCVALVPANTVLTASNITNNPFKDGLPEGWISLTDNEKKVLSGLNDFQNLSVTVDVETAGDYKVVFAWRNDENGAGDDVPAAIDNFHINMDIVPTGMVVSDITTTSAVVSWNDDNITTSWNLQYREEGGEWSSVSEISGTPSYTFNNILDSGTTYEVRVQFDNGTDWASRTFSTPLCDDGCEINYELTDAYGDGWSGNAIQLVDYYTNEVITTLTISDGSTLSGSYSMCNGRKIKFIWVSGSWGDECGFTITDPVGNDIVSHSVGTEPEEGELAVYTHYCNPTFITDGDWDVATNWSSGAVPASTDDVIIVANCTIPSDCIAQANTITLDGGSITIEDGAQLICDNSVAATFKKTMPTPAAPSTKDEPVDVYGWELISSPVHDGATDGTNAVIAVTNVTNLTTSTYDMFAYDEANVQWLNQKANDNPATVGFNTLSNGQGYMYRNNGQELSFVGNTNVETFTKDLSYTTGAGDLAGFHLVGNPYAENITLMNTTLYDGTGPLDTQLSAYYILKDNGSAWKTDLAANTPIANKQGFLIQIPEEATKIQFSRTARTAKSHGDNIKFMVANSQFEDVTYALFDKALPLNKINHRNPEVPMIYINQNDQDYAVATMTDDTKVFGLNFKAATAGKYTLSYKAIGDYNYLHVIDRMTGEDVDMLLEGEYSFIGTPKDSENRFIVHLEYMPNYGEDGNDIFAYQSGSEILVSGQGELQVFDVTGRRVMTTTINGAESISIPAQGVYIFKLNEKVQKIVVR